MTDISPQLIEKYSVSGPRYTSYPTAVEFTANYSTQQWQSDLIAEAKSAPICIYVHIPFCFSQCYFCACSRTTPKSRDVVKPYLEAIYRELSLYRSFLGGDIEVEQIHWGGGSPDYLLPQEMTELFGQIGKAFPRLKEDAEIAIEVDPRNTSQKQLEVLKSLGFNRLSMGVQDFDPLVQQTINRIQPYEMTKGLIEQARNLGLSSINIDLIYGLPNQTIEGFSKTIEQIIELRPSRIALYGYAHVTWLKKAQNVFDQAQLPTPSERIELFLMALNRLSAAGYEYIGMDHFALPQDELTEARNSGKLNRNFMGYTTHRGSCVLGIGATSISSTPKAYAQNVKDVDSYCEQLKQGKLAIERGVKKTFDDCVRGEVIEALLCSGIVDKTAIERRFDINFSDYFSGSIKNLTEQQRDGLVEVAESHITLTPRGRILARNVAMAFDSYLAKYQKTNRPVFSKTV